MTPYAVEIQAAARRHHLDPAIVTALVDVESSFDPYAWNPESSYRYLMHVRTWKPFRKLTAAERASEVPPNDFPCLAGDPDQEWWGQQASWGLCVAQGTPVATAVGWLPIESVNPGASVLDRSGRLTSVTAVTAREAECLDVRLALNPALSLTAEHPLFVRKSTLGRHSTGRRRVITADQPEWVQASDLSEWDMVAMPRAVPTVDVESVQLLDLLGRPPGRRDGTEYADDDGDLVMRYRSGGRERARLQNVVRVEADLLELIGLYLAEGHALEKRKGVAFSFHEREIHLHARVLELFRSAFGVDPSYRLQRHPQAHGVQVIVYGPAARWLSLQVPGKALTKAVPSWTLWLPPSKQAALVRGMWLGDGCLGRGVYTTASQALAYGMAHLLLRLGIVARLTPTRSWFNVSLNSHDSVNRFKETTGLSVIWPMTSGGLQRHTSIAWRADADFIYFPVRSVAPSGYRRVYDLQVPADSSFVAGRSVVHNCQVMGAVAREHRFRGPYLTELTNPILNLNYGCRHIARLLTWAKGDVERALAAYNGGTAGNLTRPLRNAAYAQKVLTKAEKGL